ncbi:MAG: DUF1146 family protein [Acholeplasmatales bacterium]
MRYYFYFGGLLVGFIWSFKSLQAIKIEKVMEQNRIWEIRSLYTLMSLLAGHVIGTIFEYIYLMINGAIQ